MKRMKAKKKIGSVNFFRTQSAKICGYLCDPKDLRKELLPIPWKTTFKIIFLYLVSPHTPSPLVSKHIPPPIVH